jgi:hypothetical protein
MPGKPGQRNEGCAGEPGFLPIHFGQPSERRQTLDFPKYLYKSRTLFSSSKQNQTAVLPSSDGEASLRIVEREEESDVSEMSTKRFENGVCMDSQLCDEGLKPPLLKSRCTKNLEVDLPSHRVEPNSHLLFGDDEGPKPFRRRTCLSSLIFFAATRRKRSHRKGAS